jgi:hypothetical protein
MPFLAACGVHTLPTITPTIVQMPSTVITLTPSPPSSITPNSLPPTDQSLGNTPGRLLINVEHICPNERIVPLSTLGFSTDYRIIVGEENSSQGGLLMLGGSDTVPIPIANTSPESGYHYKFIRTSPDGKWFLYYKVLIDTFQAELWISSFDGEQQWQLISNDARDAVGWVSNDEIIIASRLNERENATPILLINPFTLKKVSFPPIPESGISLEWWNYLDNNYEIYYDKYYELTSGEYVKRFVIYNYNTNEGQIAFQWLNDEMEFFNDPSNLFYMFRLFETPDRLISMVMVRPYGFDIAVNLDIDTILTENNYQDIMHPVFLPGEEADMRITWVARTSPIIAFDRLTYGQSEPRSTQFYVINYQTMRMIDYCYDRGYIPQTINTSSDEIGHTSIVSYVSPDERYLAWNIYNLEDGNVVGASIIDLETGYVSYVQDIEIIGWGVIQR